MENTAREIPAFVLEAWEDAHRRITAFAAGKPLFTLAQITDVHTGNNDRYRQLGYLDALADRYPFDQLANFGDIGLDFSGDRNVETDDVREEIVRKTQHGMTPAHPWLYLKGNHDRVLSRDRLADVFNRQFAKTQSDLVFGSPLCDYGYRDYPAKKVRFVFLDTSDNDDGVHYSFSVSQLRFLASVLESCPAGYRVIVGSHFCLDRNAGKWRSYQNDGESAEFRCLRRMLADFVHRAAKTDEETGVHWDFSQSSATLLCALAGDSHFNADLRRDGVYFVVRQGYGGIGLAEMPEWATKDPFDAACAVNFDVLAVREDGRARLFRVGAGAGVRDLSLSE